MLALTDWHDLKGWCETRKVALRPAGIGAVSLACVLPGGFIPLELRRSRTGIELRTEAGAVLAQGSALVSLLDAIDAGIAVAG